MSDPIQKICQILANKLQAGSSHNTNEIVTSLRAELDANPSLIEALQKDERVVQINLGDSKGFQTLVEEGGIANIGNHYHLDTHEVVQQLAQVLQELIAQRPTSNPNNLPRSGVKEFVGRNQKLQDLHEQLQNSQRIAITAIAGMGHWENRAGIAVRYFSIRTEALPWWVLLVESQGPRDSNPNCFVCSD
ncbi:hypothetical protein [Acaryochloris sp. 'Moss Beach']|uniref:hypothetical protein n=1 Tax=Acaryochloris sp. 'Moss Beach' TaxID=2740837 RepID=UPI001F1AC41F|nr:hypothetical protein [Acaryochloris sp. 'Moss Beach']